MQKGCLASYNSLLQSAVNQGVACIPCKSLGLEFIKTLSSV